MEGIFEHILAGRFGDTLNGDYGRPAADAADRLLDRLWELSNARALALFRAGGLDRADLDRLEAAWLDRAGEQDGDARRERGAPY